MMPRGREIGMECACLALEEEGKSNKEGVVCERHEGAKLM